MAICLGIQPIQGDPDMVDFVIIGNTSTPPENCAMVALTGAEYQSIVSGPFALTVEQGAQVGGAILLVWAIAWVFRALSRILSTDEKET